MLFLFGDFGDPDTGRVEGIGWQSGTLPRPNNGDHDSSHVGHVAPEEGVATALGRRGLVA